MKLYVDKDIVLKFLGYGNKKAPKIIEKKLDEELKVYDEYLSPEYYIKETKIDYSKEGVIVFDDELSIESSYLYSKLKDKKKAYVVVYTVGKKIEDIIDDYSNNAEMMKAMIVDKMGVVALDNLRDKIIGKIEKEEYPKFISSASYPSQGDFKVEHQKVLFKLFGNKDMNISINESSQFTPLKTVLLIYGIGDRKNTTSMCEECENKCDKAN